MRAGKNGQADHIHVFLKRGVHDHLGRLAQAGIDDFHAGVTQCPSNHLGPAVVPIQPWLGNQYANFLLRHSLHLTTEVRGAHSGPKNQQGEAISNTSEADSVL